MAGNDKRQRLVPKPVVPFAPLRQEERQHYLNLLYRQYVEVRDKYRRKFSATNKAIEKEYAIANSNKQKGEYLSQIKKILFSLKKYGSEDGKPVTNATSNGNTENSQMESAVKSQYNFIHSFENVLKELDELCISVARLKRHGYVTENIEDEELPEFADCAHCGEKFNISKIDSQVKCFFHPGKIQTSTYENLKLGKKIYGTQYADWSFSCCKQKKGESRGCQTLNHHVFKLQKAGQLNTVKPFKTIQKLRSELRIDQNSKLQVQRKDKIKAVGIDCEMCYTNLGFEMMKVSITDFKSQKGLIDCVVHPDGDLVIDLNSHVSGVTEIPKSAMTFDEVMIKLAELTDEDTIIVGHGLENDLNVLRLIYPKIVDTAIILSENQVDPRRKDPLKQLAWKYLSENIQLGEHDSLEDAIIPMRIIKAFIGQRLDRKEKIALSS